MQACLHPEPEKRLSCWELLRLPYFANAETWFPADFWGAHVRHPLKERLGLLLRRHTCLSCVRKMRNDTHVLSFCAP